MSHDDAGPAEGERRGSPGRRYSDNRAYDMALEALHTAETAASAIARHEAVCAERFNLIKIMLQVMLAMFGAVIVGLAAVSWHLIEQRLDHSGLEQGISNTYQYRRDIGPLEGSRP